MMQGERARQFDLFGQPTAKDGEERSQRGIRRHRQTTAPLLASVGNPEAMARHLESTGAYRILRRL
nr:hypothetical protein [Jiella pacifica]